MIYMWTSFFLQQCKFSFPWGFFLSSYTFGDDEDLPSTSLEVKNIHIEKPVLALGKLEAHDSLNDKPRCDLEDVNGVVEMQDSLVCKT